jgi:hypothetical protein
MASQIQPWEREVKDGLAMLPPPITYTHRIHPPPTPTAYAQRLHPPTPTPPTVDVSDTTTTQMRQPARPHTQLGDEGGEQGLALPCLHTHRLHPPPTPTTCTHPIDHRRL